MTNEQNITRLSIFYHDQEEIDRLNAQRKIDEISLEDYICLIHKQGDWEEEIKFDNSRSLIDQVNEIAKDPRVLEIFAKNETPNPNLDGANIVAHWYRRHDPYPVVSGDDFWEYKLDK